MRYIACQGVYGGHKPYVHRWKPEWRVPGLADTAVFAAIRNPLRAPLITMATPEWLSRSRRLSLALWQAKNTNKEENWPAFGVENIL